MTTLPRRWRVRCRPPPLPQACGVWAGICARCLSACLPVRVWGECWFSCRDFPTVSLARSTRGARHFSCPALASKCFWTGLLVVRSVPKLTHSIALPMRPPQSWRVTDFVTAVTRGVRSVCEADDSARAVLRRARFRWPLATREAVCVWQLNVHNHVPEHQEQAATQSNRPPRQARMCLLDS